MSLGNKIDHLLQSDELVFDKALKMLYLENLNDTQKELERSYEFNEALFDGIQFTLKKLKQEESFMSRVLYRSFGMGKKKNIRRKHLTLLGGHLKREIYILEKEVVRSNYYYKNIKSSLNNLTQFAELLGVKIDTLNYEGLKSKCNKYLRECSMKIDVVSKYEKALNSRIIALEGFMEKYQTLLKKIPRYHELHNEKQLEYKRQK